AMTTLSFERGTALVSELLKTIQLCRDVAELAKHITRGSATAWDDAGFRLDVGRLTAELDALWALTKRNISEATRTGLVGAGGNVFKLAYTELRHRLGELAMRLIERAGLSQDDAGELATAKHLSGRFHAMAMSIAAGTTQVQRNIIAERLLGLPKEPRFS
ncbi:MAG TPA: acyl-CoA dehydrogenase family protein, partial [Jatrophihabitantaceae bacterium]|nr:acyl-CoA dehydrogenase family protein [Jatrophihabitantaceae bacterium]